MNARMSVVLAATACVVTLDAHAALKVSDLSCQSAKSMTVNFPAGEVPFPNGTTVTHQFKPAGLIFSSTNPQNNFVQDGYFYNPDRIQFITTEPVVSVSITLTDSNLNLQTHLLSAYDRNNNLLDLATFTDPSPGTYPQLCGVVQGCQNSSPDRFTLTVSSCKGIAYVIVDAQPPGAQTLDTIVYRLK